MEDFKRKVKIEVECHVIKGSVFLTQDLRSIIESIEKAVREEEDLKAALPIYHVRSNTEKFRTMCGCVHDGDCLVSKKPSNRGPFAWKRETIDGTLKGVHVDRVCRDCRIAYAGLPAIEASERFVAKVKAKKLQLRHIRGKVGVFHIHGPILGHPLCKAEGCLEIVSNGYVDNKPFVYEGILVPQDKICPSCMGLWLKSLPDLTTFNGMAGKKIC